MRFQKQKKIEILIKENRKVMEKEYLTKIVKQLEKLIKLNDKYFKHEFWNPAILDRPSKQKLMNEDTFGEFRFDFNNNSYFISSYLRINSKSFDFKKTILKNDKKTNMKGIKALLKRIQEEIKEIDRNT